MEISSRLIILITGEYLLMFLLFIPGLIFFADGYLYFSYSSFIDCNDSEFKIFVLNQIIFPREFTFDLQDKPCQCICITFHIVENVFVEIQQLIKIVELGFSFKDKGVIVHLCI